MAIYVTSDLHFCHSKSFVWEPRGYANVEEMNEEQVRKWNEVVTNEDDVYILGDLMLEDSERGIEYIKHLNGKLHIIYGNHDSDTRKKMYNELDNVIEACFATMITYKKFHFYLSHYPTMTGNFDDDKPPRARTWCLCGHTHTKDKYLEMESGNPCYHVEVDAHDGYPVAMEDVVDDIKAWFQEKRVMMDAATDCAVSAAAPILAPATSAEPIAEPVGFTASEAISILASAVGKAGTADPPDGGYYG